MIPLASVDPPLSTPTKRGLLTDMRKTDPKRIIFLWKSSVSFWKSWSGTGNRGQARNLAKLHRRFAAVGPRAADGLATSDAGKPQRQRLEPESQPALSHGPKCGMEGLVGFRSAQACGFVRNRCPEHHLPAVSDLVSGRGGRLECCRLR